jgi:predicted metal-dependent phosphoesterase TrpH
MRIDLHTHSTASDGTDSPSALVLAAAAAGLDVVALTDHDTLAGWDAALAAAPVGVTLVPGVELSAYGVVAGRPVSLHLLAYWPDPDDVALSDALVTLRESRDGRARRMVAALAADGHPVTWEEVAADAQGVVGRPHVARALIRAGLVRDVSAAFTPEWIGGPGSRYWVGKAELPVLDAVRLVRGAGGAPVFAHPRAARRGATVGDDVIAAMAAAGLVGLEADHPDHEPAERAALGALAADLGLLVTGSSDYHGTNKTIGLGARTTAPAVYEALRAAAPAARAGR